MAGGTRSSCRMASASCRSCAALRVSRSGSPGPAPTIWAMPTGDSRRRRRRVRPAPRAARRPRRRPARDAPPAPRPGGARSRGGGPGSAIRAFTWARKVMARLASAPIRSGSTASIRPRKTLASVGDAPPVEIATTTPSRSTMAGRMKSQSAGRSATFTGTPAALARRWTAVSPSSRAGRHERRDGTAKICCRDRCGRAAPHRRPPSARAQRGGPPSAPRPITTTLRPARSKNSGRCFTRRPRAARR